MKILIIVFLLIIAGVFFTLYIFNRKEIKNISNQLKKIYKKDTNSKILLSSPNKSLEELALQINKTIEEKQEIKSEYNKMDIELRQAIANMSHDLRTPLTSIMGYIQLIEDNNLTEKERRKYTEIIKRRAKSLESLISSFYDFSRLESKEYHLELESINLSTIVSEIIASFYTDFINKGIEPIINIDDNVSNTIADEKAVGRVVFNLVENMLKYGNDYINIQLKEEDGYISTTFENDAPNLKEEDVPRLFNRFFTANNARSDNSSGLGLAITKQFVEQMGHRISGEYMDNKLKIIIKWKII